MMNLEASNARVSLPLDSSLQSSSNLDEAMDFVDDSILPEQFLVEDLDSYFEDINNCLTISRMVSNSVIMGMVSAFSEEFAEKIASKEAEVLLLQKRLHSYESNGHEGIALISSAVVEPRRMNSKGQLNSRNIQELGLEHNCINEDMDNLKIAAEKQFQRIEKELEDLKGHSSTTDLDSAQKQQISETLVFVEKDLNNLESILTAVYERSNKVVLSGSHLFEYDWEQELQKEMDHIVFHSCLCHNQNKKVFTKVDELSSLCQDLNDISRSLFGPEPSKVPSLGSFESVEELTNERKDEIQQRTLGDHLLPSKTLQDQIWGSCIENLKESETMPPETIDYLQLERLPNEAIINYFKKKLTDMRRAYELSLQKMTEHYFCLRRRLLKEKGSCHNMKDKNFDNLRKKIPEVILKLNDILLENEKLPIFCDCYENISDLKERLNNLLSKNKHLHDLLQQKSEEVASFSSKLLDSDSILHHSMSEADVLNCIKQKEFDIEDLKMENAIGEDVCKCFLGEFIGQNICDLDIQDSFVSEISAIIFQQAIRDAKAAMNLSIAKQDEEKEGKVQLEKELLEIVNALCFATKEIGKLEEEQKEMVHALIKETETSALEMGSSLMEQGNFVELISQELNSLRDQTKHQEALLLELKRESNLMKSRLDEALEKIGLYEEEISKLKQKLRVTENNLTKAEGERSTLIQLNHNSISAAISKEQEQRKTTGAIFTSVNELSTVMADFECKATENMKQNNSRLEMLNQQYRMLIQQADTFRRKELVYKQKLEQRCSDLKMAEAEVDLLGDKVDALLSLLSKIHVALDHYSLILQHYPGIMEILKLVRRELKGQPNEDPKGAHDLENLISTSSCVGANPMEGAVSKGKHVSQPQLHREECE